MRPLTPGHRLLSVIEAACALGVSKSWLDKKRAEGGGPPYVKLGRRVVYDWRDVEPWLLSNRKPNTPAN